jgi:phage shock protein PspC (stress-responsive transcriptional regulator)
MYCNHCGKRIQDDANLCAYCGRKVVGAPVRRPLVRPRDGRKIAGVCLAFAGHFDRDPTLVRVLWLLAVALTVPLAIVGYFVAWIVIPEEPSARRVAPGPAASAAPEAESAGTGR